MVRDRGGFDGLEADLAWLPGEHLLLKYHNLHEDDDEYHHRIYAHDSGEEIGYERLAREQFPTLSEVLDELDTMTEPLGSST